MKANLLKLSQQKINDPKVYFNSFKVERCQVEVSISPTLLHSIRTVHPHPGFLHRPGSMGTEVTRAPGNIKKA